MNDFREISSKKYEIMIRAGGLISIFTHIRVIVILGAKLKAMTEIIKDLVMIGKC